MRLTDGLSGYGQNAQQAKREGRNQNHEFRSETDNGKVDQDNEDSSEDKKITVFNWMLFNLKRLPFMKA